MEELATNRIVPQPGGRLGGREICAPICGRLGPSMRYSSKPTRAFGRSKTMPTLHALTKARTFRMPCAAG